MTSPRKIALFGGTFDPVHLGHIHLATMAKTNLDLDEVRFLPCQISPHKSQRRPSSGEDRCEMLRLATADLPWAVVDDFELHQPIPSFSYLTAESMAARFPDSRLYWIMGGDHWDALTRWKHPEILAQLVEFVVLARGEIPKPRDGFQLHIIQEQHPASATEIRKANSNEEANHPWLDPRVAEWIRRNGIYQP